MCIIARRDDRLFYLYIMYGNSFFEKCTDDFHYNNAT